MIIILEMMQGVVHTNTLIRSVDIRVNYFSKYELLYL